jgi:hypothetical protein
VKEENAVNVDFICTFERTTYISTLNLGCEPFQKVTLREIQFQKIRRFKKTTFRAQRLSLSSLFYVVLVVDLPRHQNIEGKKIWTKFFFSKKTVSRKIRRKQKKWFHKFCFAA